MKIVFVAAISLFSVASAMAEEVYDHIYVSDPAVCERAGEEDMSAVLFELSAAAVSPREGIWVGGEMTCTLADVSTNMSPIGWESEDGEVLATARCLGPYLDFRDELVLTTSSQGINLHYGDTGETPPLSLEIMSMRADIGGDEVAQTDGYDGIYTVCRALSAEDFAWTP